MKTEARRMSDEATDEELMAAAATGSEQAFRRLAARHGPRTFRLACRLVRNPADAEEIVQEALLRAWVNAPTWRPIAAFRTWLYRVVVNLAIDRQRQGLKRGRFTRLTEAGDLVDPQPDAAALLARDEAARLVSRAIAALPDRQRAALVLTHHEGLSNAEAADILGTSVGGIEGLLVRARRSLRGQLEPLLRE